MPNAKLIVLAAGREPREIEILGDVTTFGRTSDNSVSFAGDGNVSRYHAQIERRGDDFFISDFNSSNGTTLNDQPVKSETKLTQGDQIKFGGENSIVIFKNEEEPQAVAEDADETANSSAQKGEVATGLPANSQSESGGAQSKSNVPLMLTAAAVLSGLAIVAVVAVVIVTQTNFIGGSCGGTPEVAILSPESGTTISEPTEVKVSVKNAKCVERVAYLLDGEEVETAETEPYSVTLDPEKFEHLKDDGSHVLTVAVVDRKGERRLQMDELNLAFGATESGDQSNKSTVGENKSDDSTAPASSPSKGGTLTIAETKTLAEQFLKQFPGAYKLNVAFLAEVSKKTADYKSDGFSRRAAPYRDAINQAFVQEQGLDASLGYVLAMSQSRFDLKKNGGAEGLWQMTNDFAQSNGYNGLCGTETLSDGKQICAARAAAIYSKALVTNLFQGDVIYGISCFGLSPSDAGQFQVSLPADRSDFWSVIKSPKQKDMLIRFFAAGIVAENPQRFGLKQDKPLSSLYKNLLVPK